MDFTLLLDALGRMPYGGQRQHGQQDDDGAGENIQVANVAAAAADRDVDGGMVTSVRPAPGGSRLDPRARPAGAVAGIREWAGRAALAHPAPVAAADPRRPRAVPTPGLRHRDELHRPRQRGTGLGLFAGCAEHLHQVLPTCITRPGGRGCAASGGRGLGGRAGRRPRPDGPPGSCGPRVGLRRRGVRRRRTCPSAAAADSAVPSVEPRQVPSGVRPDRGRHGTPDELDRSG